MNVLTSDMILKRSKCLDLTEIKKINFWGYSLLDISAISQCKLLESASFSGNRITSLKCFQNMQNLHELSLANNDISDPSEIRYLSSCTNLKILWLKGNPICNLPNYRFAVIVLLPNLIKLDDKEITSNERQIARSTSDYNENNFGNEIPYPNYQNDRNINVNNYVYEKNDMKDYYRKKESIPINKNKNYIMKKGKQKLYLGEKKIQKSQRGYTPDYHAQERYIKDNNYNVYGEGYKKIKSNDYNAQNYYPNSEQKSNRKLYRSIDDKKTKNYYINNEYNNGYNNQYGNEYNINGYYNQYNGYNNNEYGDSQYNNNGYDNYDSRNLYKENIKNENIKNPRYPRQIPNSAQSHNRNMGVSSTNGQQGLIDCISMLLKRLTNDELLYIKEHIDKKISKY